MAKKKKKSKSSGSKPLSDKRFLAEKARFLPIYACYVTDEWEKAGEAQVVVARERPNGNLCVGIFLCDAWCLGVKDVFGAVNITKEDFQKRVLDRNDLLKECDYVYAHNLIYGSEAFAAEVDIKPTPEFARWSRVLEEDTDDVPLIEIEFGDHGKYHLVAKAGSKDALYAHRLKQKLGDDFTYEIGYGSDIFRDDDNDNYEYNDDYSDFGEGDFEPKSMADLLRKASDGFSKAKAEDCRHPEEVYSYIRPEYPDKLEIKHEFIAEEFQKPSNSPVLPTEIIDRILALPKDEVVRDINNIVMFTIGKTWKPIDEDAKEWNNDDTIVHSLAFLAQLGDADGANAVLEVLRQDNAFHEFHLSDVASMILPQALYATAKDNPEIILEFLQTPGYDGYAKSYASEALSFIAMEQPERRDEIIGIYRQYLNFMQENMPTHKGCSGYVAASVVSDLIDLKAKELLPEIKKLHDSGYVNLNVCGSYEKVEREINSDKAPLAEFDFKDIKDFYLMMERTFKDS